MGIKAPGNLLLLLATAAISLHHGAATTSSTTSLSCGVEFQNCLEDTECDECNAPENFDAYIDCMNAAEEATSCALYSTSRCCRDAASDYDCLGNDIFVAYHLCMINLLEECTALDCGALGGNEDGGISDTRTSGTYYGPGDDGDATGSEHETDDGAAASGTDDYGVIGGTDDGGDTTGSEEDTDDGAGSSGTHDHGSLSDTDGQCSVEGQACFDDEGCLECTAAADGFDLDEWTECLEQYVLDESDVCAFYTKGICCADAQSPADCAGNAAFVALNLCMGSQASLSVGQGECTTFTCSGDGIVGETDDGADASGGDATGAAGVGTSPWIVVFTLVLGVAFL